MHEIPQPPRLFAGASLQVGIAELSLSALLGGQHIHLLHRKPGGSGQGEELTKLERGFGIVNPRGQRRITGGMEQKSVKLLKGHGRRRRLGGNRTLCQPRPDRATKADRKHGWALIGIALT